MKAANFLRWFVAFGTMALFQADDALANSVVNSGSCTIIVQGNNNQTQFSGNCSSVREKVLLDSAGDGRPNVCWINSEQPLSSQCTIYYSRHETVYGLGDTSPLHLTGRYVGAVSNNIPNGKGQFIASDIKGPVTLIFSFVNSKDEPDLYSEFKRGRTVLFDGEWSNGDFTGRGKIVMPQGGTMEGRFQNAVLMDGRATGILPRTIGMAYYYPNGRFTGSVIEGRIRSGEVRSVEERNHEVWTVIDKGNFENERVTSGTRTLSDLRGVVWVETFSNGIARRTYSRD